MLNNFSSNQAIAKINYAIFFYTHLAHTTSKQYADDIYTKSCKVADIDKEANLGIIFIIGVNLFLFIILWEHRTLHLQAGVMYIAFKAQLLLVTQGGAANLDDTGSQVLSSK